MVFGSGKTYTTNALIEEIIKYIVKSANNDDKKNKKISEIKLKYFEVPSLVVKDREILMSGRYQSASANFNKAYYDSFEEQEIKLYATDDAKYHIEVPLAKKPIIEYNQQVMEEFMKFYRLEPNGLTFLFDVIKHPDNKRMLIEN